MIFRKWWQKLRCNPEKAAHWATIIGNGATVITAVVAISALLFGYFQFKNTQEDTRATLQLEMGVLEQERLTLAVNLYVKYAESMRDAPMTQNLKYPSPGFWRGVLAISITEQIYLLTLGDAGWDKTVRYMTLDHKRWIEENFCDGVATFAEDFVKLVEEETGVTC